MNHRHVVVVLLALAASVPAASRVAGKDTASGASIAVDNYANGEVVRHPVVLLRGSAPDDASAVVVVNESSTRETKELPGVARKGRFLGLADLVPGENRLTIRADAAERHFVLVHRPQTNSHVVRCIYLTDSSGDTTYQSPLDGDPQDFANKLSTSMKVLQCFTAERLHDLGFPRATFRLETDTNGKVDVHVQRGERPAAKEYELPDQDWWREVDDFVRRTMPAPKAKNVVVAAYTRFDPASHRVHGHTALGGGDQGLFGSAGMFAWPSRLAGVFAAFADRTPVDGNRVHDDSVGRSTHWGLASTTLGAVLHETGHAFGLPHTTEPMDIMTRGFDRLNRAFSLVEPPGKRGGPEVEFGPGEIACFAPISASELVASPWFQPDDVPDPDTVPGSPPTATVDDKGATIESSRGLRFVGLMRGGEEVGFRAFAPPATLPHRLVIPDAELSTDRGPVTELRMVDAVGAHGSAAVAVPSRFVRTWHVAKKPDPCPDVSRLPDLDKDGLSGRVAVAERGDVLTSKTAFVDLLDHFGSSARDASVYLTRRISVATANKVVIATGSDDAIRVWVDEKLVQKQAVLRDAAPDQDRATVDLAQGSHRLLVEVSNHLGGFGFYLRFEDEKGKPLRLTDDGHLVPLP